MSVNQLRPFERHMVSNISTLLATGQPLSSLGVGQLGIFDAKTNLSVTAPTYQANRNIYFAQGTPDKSAFPEGAGVPNMYRKSHVINGKSVKALYGKAASYGNGEIVTLGNTGAAGDTKTLSAKPGETFYYYIRLTGEPIFNLNPDRAKGVIIQGAVQMPCADECSDNCGTVSCDVIVSKIIEDYNGHLDSQTGKFVGGKFLPGGQRANQYASISPVLTACVDENKYADICGFTLTIPDDGSQSALGEVQAQFPGQVITRTGRQGIFSTYSTQNIDCTTPGDFTQASGTVVPNCTTCPQGSTAIAAKTVFQVTAEVSDAGDVATFIAAVAAAGGGGVYTATLLQTDALTGVSTFTVTATLGTTYATAATDLGAVTGFLSVTLVGQSAPSCLLTGTTYSWSESGVVGKVADVSFTIETSNNCEKDCATLLAELQALYTGIATEWGTAPVEIVGGGPSASGDCVCAFTLTTQSYNVVPADCKPEAVIFPLIPAFNGEDWTAVPLASQTNCYCGIQLQSDFNPRLENQCTFGYFVRQYDWVHIEISSHNPDWRSTDLCEVDPKATRIQNGAYPNGDGSAVVRIEKKDRMYDMDYWYLAPNLREAFDFYFEAKFDLYYDMVGIEFEYEYASNAFFGQTDHDRYIQYFWLPTTQAGNLVTALNTYAASAAVNVEPIVL
jgi:hypothetical protein